MWQSWMNILAGIWLIICGFIPQLRTPASLIAAGAAVLVFGFWNTAQIKSWQGIINGLAGIWLFLSGLWFGIFFQWNFLIFGVLITLVAFWNSAQHNHPEHAPVH